MVRPEGAARSLVLTMDVVTPIVDDPVAFGAIAAANSLSDVYAMGGRPELALTFLAAPESLGLGVLEQVMAGVADACRRAGCAIVGGHTMKDTEPKCGLSVVGSVDPARVWSHRFARPGDALVLTKAIGTGLIGQSVRKGDADEGHVAAAVARMTQLNDVACELGQAAGVHAATDITGFGLLGHLKHLVEASGVAAELAAGKIPILDGALALAEGGCVPGGTRANLKYVAGVAAFAPGVDEPLQLVLADAQTSGGLLMALEPAAAPSLVASLRAAGIVDAAVIGTLGPGPARIAVAR